MSYLNALRLNFAGQFQSNVSTVNNDPGHFDNASFKPRYQEMQGAKGAPMNGWFNPQGDAAFRLRGCTVTSAWTASGPVTNDPVLGSVVADSGNSAPGKLVDLDPEQQLVSEIWGLVVRITDAKGHTLVRGEYVPAAFIDIWTRATGSGSGGDVVGGATYQSVLKDLVWSDVSKSPFLTALKAAADATGMLSIKFNVDGVNLTFTSPDFMCGRIAGTIGPYLAGEPLHLVVGRQFMAEPGPQSAFFTPRGGINFFPASVDSTNSCIYLDLGNALSTTVPGGPPNNVGDLTLNAVNLGDPLHPAVSVVPVGTIPATGTGGYATDPNWYANTAGVVALPLTAAQLALVETNPLALTGNSGIAISEWQNAAFVRADTFVFRAYPNPAPNNTVEVAVYAMQFGRPLANTAISFVFDSSQLQPGSFTTKVQPPVATPLSAVNFAPTANTNAQGVATLTMSVSDPGTPRYFNGNYGIDGQVYGVRPAFAVAAMNAGPTNQWNFISLLLWSNYAIPASPTWSDIEPFMQQYANLYPVMLRFLNMGDYESVRAHAGLLSLAFGLDVSDPNSMPVTRDLSPAKRQTVLTWLKHPVYGTSKPKAAALAATAAEAPPPLPKGAAEAILQNSGKTAAIARRLINHVR